LVIHRQQELLTLTRQIALCLIGEEQENHRSKKYCHAMRAGVEGKWMCLLALDKIGHGEQ